MATLWQKNSCWKLSSAKYHSDAFEKDPEEKLENRAIISGQNWQALRYIFSSSLFFLFFILYLILLGGGCGRGLFWGFIFFCFPLFSLFSLFPILQAVT